MHTEPPRAESPKHKRRWFQFSLRSVMVFTMVCAIPCAWLNRKIDRKRKEWEAVEAIVKLGGQAHYDYQRFTDGKPPGPAWLRNLLGENFFSEVDVVNLLDARGLPLDRLDELTQLREVDLRRTRTTDAGLAHLKGLIRLEALDLQRTEISDAGLVNLEGLTNLEALCLSHTHITDAGLASLKGLTRLQMLDLQSTEVSDSGLINLAELNRLRSLYLIHTNVSDAGLAHLKGLVQLKSLYLAGTKISDAGVSDLQKSLPSCKIYR
jgi:Leucine-rich repeat (LRR) protein